MDNGATFRVYVIDDDSLVLASIEKLLESHGIETSSYSSAEEFLALVHEDWRGCVVSDLRLNGMSGIDLQLEIVQNYPCLDVVIISGGADVEATVKAMSIGAITLIEKPFHSSELLRAIDRARTKQAQAALTRLPLNLK